MDQSDDDSKQSSPSAQDGAVGPDDLSQALEVIRTEGTLSVRNVEEKILTKIGSMSVRGDVNAGILNLGHVHVNMKPPGTDEDCVADEDIKEFLEVMNNHTLKRIQYDICGIE